MDSEQKKARLSQYFTQSEDALRAEVKASIQTSLEPDFDVRPSVWCEANLVLPAGVSNITGPLRFHPYQTPIVDVIVEPDVKEVWVIKASRIGWSQVIAAQCLFLAAKKGSPIVPIFPKESSSRKFERTYLRKMILASPVLRGLIPDMEKQEWRNKAFLNGSTIELKDAITPDSFSEYAARYMFGDEVDRRPWNTGGEKTSEGSKPAIMKRRMDNYDDGIMLLGSSPGLKGHSRIEEGYLRGDQRQFFAPCPSCGEHQILEWGGPRKGYGVMWPEGKPLKAFYRCKSCGHDIPQSAQLEMVQKGDFKPTAVGEPGVVSFKVPALISPLGAVSWGRLAVEFERANKAAKEGDFDLLQAFVNTVLAETWEPRAGSKVVNAHELEENMEHFEFEVPEGVRFTTMGMDIQSGPDGSGGYAIASVWGWGQGEECWLIGRYRFNKVHPFGDPLGKLEVEDFILNKRFRTSDGRDMKILATCIDSGGKDYTQDVYEITRRLHTRNVWAIKGRSLPKGVRSGQIWPKDPTRTSAASLLFPIDTGMIKDRLAQKLNYGHKRSAPAHLPFEGADGSEPIDTEYFNGLTLEKPLLVKDGGGSVHWETKKKGNEPWDEFAYAYAATQGLQAIRGGKTIAAWLVPEKAKAAIREWAQAKAETKAQEADIPNAEIVEEKPKVEPKKEPLKLSQMELIAERLKANANKSPVNAKPTPVQAQRPRSNWMNT